MTSEGNKNKDEILALLETIWLPKKVAIIHCPGHQNSGSEVAQGNSFTDQTAKEASRKPVEPTDILLVLLPRVLMDTTTYTPGEVELCQKLGGKEESAG